CLVSCLLLRWCSRSKALNYAFLQLPMFFFFFNDTPTTEIYTLSLHDALPISEPSPRSAGISLACSAGLAGAVRARRSEEHTSELQSRPHLVCRLLLEKKKKNNKPPSVDKKKKKKKIK